MNLLRFLGSGRQNTSPTLLPYLDFYCSIVVVFLVAYTYLSMFLDYSNEFFPMTDIVFRKEINYVCRDAKVLLRRRAHRKISSVKSCSICMR